MYGRYCWRQLRFDTHFRFLLRVIVVLELCVIGRQKNPYPRPSHKPPPGSFFLLEELVFAICFVQHYKKTVSQPGMAYVCVYVCEENMHSGVCVRVCVCQAQGLPVLYM